MNDLKRANGVMLKQRVHVQRYQLVCVQSNQSVERKMLMLCYALKNWQEASLPHVPN